MMERYETIDSWEGPEEVFVLERGLHSMLASDVLMTNERDSRVQDCFFRGRLCRPMRTCWTTASERF